MPSLDRERSLEEEALRSHREAGHRLNPRLSLEPGGLCDRFFYSLTWELLKLSI